MQVDTEIARGYLEDYLLQRGLSLRRPFRCLNPSHEDRHPSMSYDSQRKNVHCFACGATYDLFDLVGLDYGIESFVSKAEKVRELFGDSVVSLPEPPKQRAAVVRLEDKSLQLAEMKGRASGDLEYFLSRGVSVDTCRAYDLFQMEGRAYFPVIEDGVCTGWCGRAIDEGLQPRYRNSSGSFGLWNGDVLNQKGHGKRLFVTEGIFDALCLIQMGEAAVSLCGSQNTAKLIRRCQGRLREASGWRFVLCGDPDDAGGRMNESLQRELGGLGLECHVLPLTAQDGDVAALYRRDPDRLTALLEQTESAGTVSAAIPSAAERLDEFFAASQRRGERGAIPTGFSLLDQKLDGGLYPGLYILGAISSLGKTSFVLQMADYVAENAADVLFFSLEQSNHELMAKSLSRTSALLASRREEAFTARQLLNGGLPQTLGARQLMLDTREAYSQAAAGLFLREGIDGLGVEDIRRGVREHLATRGRAPVVVVDYLQILSPNDLRATDKQNTDRNVVELKRISRDFDIPVVAVSSFNRENYRSAVSMEAFKESGAVEYSSDVLLGLQLKGAGERDFDVNKAKLRQPRQLELVILKNRSGLPYAKLPFHYDACYHLFAEEGKVSRIYPRTVALR